MIYSTFENSQHYEKLKNTCCQVPFTDLHIYHNGDVCNCCFTWLPTHIGNVLENTLLNIIDGELAKSVKTSVTDGSYKHCSTELCPKLSEIIHFGKVATPLMSHEEFKKVNTKKIHIYLNYDLSCNLFCGSCRNERILYTDETAPEILKLIHSRVMEQIQELIDHGYDITLNVTGSGDPFASPLYWKFLNSLDESSPLKLELSTNGTLMTKERLEMGFAKRVKYIGVSVDAATEETYIKVRRGGNFRSVKNNLDSLNDLVKNKKLPNLKNWRLNFVVQKDNFFEMADFAKWALKYDTIGEVWFNLIANWGHMSNEVFVDRAVWKPEHPQHDEFLEILKDPIFNHPRILLGNAAPYKNQALELYE